MRLRGTPSFFGAGAALGLCASAGLAQCRNTAWTNQFANPGSGLVQSGWLLQTFDADGPGPVHAELYIAGNLLGAGSVTTNGIVRWDGHQFFDVGGGLYRPTQPSRVGGLGLHDPDGPGPLPARLIAAGPFTMAGPVPVSYIASWDGSNWSSLGPGLPTFPSFSSIVMCDWDPDGPGPLLPLLVVGYGGLVYIWNGEQWADLPFVPSEVFSVAVFDEDGPGPETESLFVGLKHPPGLVKWDGAGWAVVGGGLRSAQHLCATLRVIDIDGPGPLPAALYAGGGFLEAGSVVTTGVARWDGQAWSAVAGGVTDQVTDIAAVDYTGGTGAPTLFAVGDLQGNIFRLQPGAAAWEIIGSHNFVFGTIVLPHLAVFDEDAPGSPSLYLASPTNINGQATTGIARYACLCYPNCDASAGAPALTGNDFVCFVNKFALGDSYANCDGSTGVPMLTGNDFTCFINAYAAGCFN